MKNYGFRLAYVGLSGVLALLLAACMPGIAPVAATNCLAHFEATVHQGPSQGLALKGPLTFNLDSAGQVSGLLGTGDGKNVKVSGQATGQALSLIFFVSDQQYLFGNGTAENPLYKCVGVLGGSFTGPQPGDSGDWVARIPDFTGAPNVKLDRSATNGTLTLQVTLPTQGKVTNFTCAGENVYYCTCHGAEDCGRLGQSGACDGPIVFGGPAKTEPDRGDCKLKTQ